jgi:hypothetical protein
MSKYAAAAAFAAAPPADERWTAWVARGIERDRKARKRAVDVAIAVCGLLALGSAIALMF